MYIYIYIYIFTADSLFYASVIRISWVGFPIIGNLYEMYIWTVLNRVFHSYFGQ